MYIYNVTTYVHWSIHEAWLQWMKQQHMPALVATGCFDRFQLVRLLETDETDGPTYAVQYFSHTKDDYLRYMELHEQRFSEEKRDKWGERSISFSTLMELVN